MEGAAHFMDMFGAYQSSFHPPDPSISSHQERPKFIPTTTSEQPRKSEHTLVYDPNRAARQHGHHHDEDESVFTDYMRNSGAADLKVYDQHTRKKLQDGQYIQYEKKSYKCEYCGATFSLKSRLDEHTVRHTGERVYACEICGSLFPEKEEVENHIELVHTKDKPYKCLTCGAGFILSHDLKVHENIHTWELSFKCDICGKSFSKAQALMKHKTKVHDKDEMYACRICNAQFELKGDLETHLQTHNTGLVCTICGSKFPTQSKLLQHGYSHAGKRPYICSVCDAVFGQKGHLKRHVARKHPAQKIFECILCDAAFVVQEDLDKHVKVHTASTNIQCKYCKMPFSSIVTLSMHIAQDHSQEQVERRNIMENDQYLRMGNQSLGMKPHIGLGNASKINNFSHGLSAENVTKGPQSSWTGGNNINNFDAMDSDLEEDEIVESDVRIQVANQIGMYGQTAPGKPQQMMGYGQGQQDRSQPFQQQQPPQQSSQQPPQPIKSGGLLAPENLENYSDESDSEDDVDMDKNDTLGHKKKQSQDDSDSDVGTKALLTNGTCTLCGATFVSRSNLIRHYNNVHQIDKPFYKCSQCPEKFYKKRDLDNHRLTHDGLECEICPAKFPTESQLKRHMFVHTGEKPYVCKFCPAAFDQKGQLRRHTIQRHLKEKGHQCTHCDQTFVLKSELRKHERTHTGKQAAICSECGASFALIVGLKRHIRIVHEEKRFQKYENMGADQDGDDGEKKGGNDEIANGKDSMSERGPGKDGKGKIDHIDGPESSNSIRKDHIMNGNNSQKKPEESSARHPSESSRKEPPLSMEQPLPLYNPQAFMWPGRSQESFAANPNFPETCMYSAVNKSVTEMARQMGNDQPYNPLGAIDGYPFYGSQYFQNTFNSRSGASGVDGRFPGNPAAYGGALPGMPGMPQNPGLPNLDKQSLDAHGRRMSEDDDLMKADKMKMEEKPKKELPKTFKCDCGMMFSSRSHLLRHSSVHTGLRPFACRECDSTFAQKDHLRRHIRCMHVGAKPFKCEKCGATFSQKCNLMVHVKVHEIDVVFKCDLCEMIFKKEGTLTKHKEKVHFKIEHFKCKVCKDDFTDKEELAVHIKTHDKPATCTDCGADFPNEGQYLRHHCFHSLDKPYKCDLCNACFSRHSHLKRHTIQKHIDDNLHICSFCDAGYVKLEDLEKHEKEHAGEKIFSCDVCSITFTELEALKSHRNEAHTEENSYMCKFCGDSYTSAVGLRKHEKIHKDVISHKCKICDEEFAQKAALIKHTRAEHSKRTTYFCESCDSKFTNKAKLRIHSRQHVRELGYTRMYTCDLCSVLFKRKIQLTDHKNKTHFSDMYLECSACGLKFRREHQLKKHQKEEHDIEYMQQNAFQCNLCDMSFPNISGLTIHNRGHKGQKVYVCNTCNVSLTTEEEAEDHVESEHPDDEDLKCQYCEKRFTNLSRLKRHEKRCGELEDDEEDEEDGEKEEMGEEGQDGGDVEEGHEAMEEEGKAEKEEDEDHEEMEEEEESEEEESE